MFIAKISCHDCEYETDEFVNGYDPGLGTHTFVFQNIETKCLRFAVVETQDEIKRSEQKKTVDKLCSSKEVYVDTFLQGAIAAMCPKCGKPLFIDNYGII